MHYESDAEKGKIQNIALLKGGEPDFWTDGTGPVSVGLAKVARDGWDRTRVTVLLPSPDTDSQTIEQLLPFEQILIGKKQFTELLKTKELPIPRAWSEGQPTVSEKVKTCLSTQQNRHPSTPYEDLLRHLNQKASSVYHGKKPEKMREAVTLILDFAKEQKPDLDYKVLPGRNAALLELCQRLCPRLFEVSPRTFHNYLKGDPRKYRDKKICSFTGRGENPWPEIFPDAYK